MPKYHVPVKGTKPAQGGHPLCGARRIDRYKTVTVSAADWNALPVAMRCVRCIALLRK